MKACSCNKEDCISAREMTYCAMIFIAGLQGQKIQLLIKVVSDTFDVSVDESVLFILKYSYIKIKILLPF